MAVKTQGPSDTLTLTLHRLTREELIECLEDEREGVARMRQARRYAPQLMRTMGIFPHGVEWVHWIGSPSCRNNSDAMIHWIEAHLDDAEFCEEAQHTPELDLLAQRLNECLRTMQESYAW